jgi:hypothetical protein
MRISLLIIIFLLGCKFNLAAQRNYVLNGDLEQYSICPPNRPDQVSTAKHWTSIDSNGYPLCAPEYVNACASKLSLTATVPDNGFFYQYAHSGNGMSQVLFFSDESKPMYPDYLRDYLQGRLYKKLVASKSYCVTFYVNQEEGSRYSTKEFGAYLDNGSIDTASQCGHPQTRYSPQINYTGNIINDTAGWTRIEGTFTANGSEQFITIGNFKDKANTSYITMPFNGRQHGSWFTNYLVDDVSVVESDAKAYAGDDTHVGYGDSVYIGLPSSEAIWNSWTVLGSSTVIGQGPGIWLKPTTTTSYVVTQTLCGVTTKDTVKVEVWPAGIGSINGKTQRYTLMPNPSDGNIELRQSIEEKSAVSITIYNTIGMVLYQAKKSFEASTASLDLTNLPSGMYYVVVCDKAGTPYTLRFSRK